MIDPKGSCKTGFKLLANLVQCRAHDWRHRVDSCSMPSTKCPIFWSRCESERRRGRRVSRHHCICASAGWALTCDCMRIFDSVAGEVYDIAVWELCDGLVEPEYLVNAIILHQSAPCFPQDFIPRTHLKNREFREQSNRST